VSQTKIQKRMRRYESAAFAATASSFEALPHTVTLAMNGDNAIPVSHRRPLLVTI
jgi:hypothetical protein